MKRLHTQKDLVAVLTGGSCESPAHTKDLVATLNGERVKHLLTQRILW